MLCSTLFVTPGTVAHQAPLSMGFPKQECWSGLPFPSPGDLPDSGIEPASSELAGRFFTTEPPAKPVSYCLVNNRRMSCYHERNLRFSDCFIFMIFKAICNNYFHFKFGETEITQQDSDTLVINAKIT